MEVDRLEPLQLLQEDLSLERSDTNRDSFSVSNIRIRTNQSRRHIQADSWPLGEGSIVQPAYPVDSSSSPRIHMVACLSQTGHREQENQDAQARAPRKLHPSSGNSQLRLLLPAQHHLPRVAVHRVSGKMHAKSAVQIRMPAPRTAHTQESTIQITTPAPRDPHTQKSLLSPRGSNHDARTRFADV